jgi:hypothetical protein
LRLEGVIFRHKKGYSEHPTYFEWFREPLNKPTAIRLGTD